jgi:methionine synthase I (cobalamin-dependent)
VRQVHAAYRQAGAQVLLSNTFMLHAESFRRQPFNDRGRRALPDVWRYTLDLMPPDVFRILAFGPLAGKARREFDKIASLNFPPCDVMTLPPPYRPEFDALLLETCSSQRVTYALRFWRARFDVPLLLSLSYHRNAAGQLVTASGHEPEWFARRVDQFELTALGVNCGRDMQLDDIIEVIHRYRAVTGAPLFARPNAGTPRQQDGRWVYPVTPEQLAARLPELLDAGVCMVGGCCGTTPEHIAAMRQVLEQRRSCSP